ncbi:MAG: hypothetical protein ACLQKA_08945 [Bryobacteraceae bacterium]
MIDAFPSSATDPDYQMQLQIDAQLQNAVGVQARGERTYPRAQYLYPELFEAADCQAWLMPLLRRLAWHDAQGERSAAWRLMLAEMLGFAAGSVGRVSEAEFVALTDQLERRPLRFERKMKAFARELKKAGPLSPSVVDALARLHRLAENSGPDSGVTESVVRQSSATTTAENSRACWSAGVFHDLEGMAPKLRANWTEAMDTGYNRSSDYTGKPGKATLAALKRLGNAELESRLRRWIGMFREGPGPVLTPDGAVLFRHVIELCHLLGGPVSDELLYDIARAPWKQEPDYHWIDAYLWALGCRSDDRAFACLEALMMNPVMATDEVRRRYEGLLAAFGAGAISDSPVGVDGFPLDSDPSLLPQQTRIDQLLRMAANAAAHGPYVDPGLADMLKQYRSMRQEDITRGMRQWYEHITTRPVSWFEVSPEVTAAHEATEAAILRTFSGDPASLHRAAVIRVEWIAAHEREYPKDTLKLWNEWLNGLGCRRGLVGQSIEKVEELPLKSLVRSIRSSHGNPKILDLCRKYVAERGWHADLVEPLRQWISEIGTGSSEQAFRPRAEWFVWFENVSPIDLEACWSHRIKRDLREMPPDESAGWRALLDNSVFIVTDKPTQKWLKAAEAAFPKVGADAFRRRFVAWFEPFAKGEPLRLTITGRNILRILMWCALIAKDEAVDRALLGFANAKWKTLEVVRRAAQAEMAFSYVLAQRMPETALPLLETWVATGEAFPGSATHRIYEELCARSKRKPVRPIP